MHHLWRLSLSGWQAIRCDLQSVQVRGARSPAAPAEELPLLLWGAAFDGDSQVIKLWHWWQYVILCLSLTTGNEPRIFCGFQGGKGAPNIGGDVSSCH